MEPFVITFSVLVIIIILLLFYGRRIYMNAQLVNIDGQWNVSGNYENHIEAAMLISSVNNSIIEILRAIKYKYAVDKTDDVSRLYEYPAELYPIVDTLLDNYNPDVFYENDPALSSDTSYTVNKGSAMYLCLRDREDPTKLVTKDTLLFVMLHEISHIANYNGWGHGIEFWEIFKFILNEAYLTGEYIPTDYSKYPVVYCGLEITYNPLLDDSLRNIWNKKLIN